jgi:peptidyl-prolyl cis-trans isomerase C
LTKLTKGKFTEEPVKTQFGYHVILLEDTRPKIFPLLDQVKPQLQQQIQQQNMQKLFDDLKSKAKIEIAHDTAPSVTPADKSKPAVTGK